MICHHQKTKLTKIKKILRWLNHKPSKWRHNCGLLLLWWWCICCWWRCCWWWRCWFESTCCCIVRLCATNGLYKKISFLTVNLNNFVEHLIKSRQIYIEFSIFNTIYQLKTLIFGKKYFHLNIWSMNQC